MDSALCIDGCLQCIERVHKDSIERVANRLEDHAILRRDGLAEQHIVAYQRGAHGVWLLLPESRAAFNIGEQECERASGQ